MPAICLSVCSLELGTKSPKNNNYTINSWPLYFAPLPGGPCWVDCSKFLHVGWYPRRNHAYQTLSPSRRGLRSYGVQSRGFPIHFQTALTTVFRTTVLHCDNQNANCRTALTQPLHYTFYAWGVALGVVTASWVNVRFFDEYIKKSVGSEGTDLGSADARWWVLSAAAIISDWHSRIEVFIHNPPSATLPSSCVAWLRVIFMSTRT